MSRKSLEARAIVIASLMLPLFTCKSAAQSARDYYQELYKAGGLDRMADVYACFDDDPANENFFIFSKSDVVRDFLAENGGLIKLPKAEQAALKKGFLITRGYNKGIPFSGEDNYNRDGDSWITDRFNFDKKFLGRMRLDIAWATLRYKRSVEVLNPNGSLKTAVPRFGRCERIPSQVQQKAD